MVDRHSIDNQVVEALDEPGWVLVARLLGAFRELVDEAHVLLAGRGHPEVRPVHGFALQAMGSGATASEMAARLGVSKQAAAKTVAMLEQQGYVERTGDAADARRKVVVPTRRGRELLAASAQAFDAVVDQWRARAGDATVTQLQHSLGRLGVPGSAKLDLGTWSR